MRISSLCLKINHMFWAQGCSFQRSWCVPGDPSTLGIAIWEGPGSFRQEIQTRRNPWVQEMKAGERVQRPPLAGQGCQVRGKQSLRSCHHGASQGEDTGPWRWGDDGPQSFLGSTWMDLGEPLCQATPSLSLFYTWQGQGGGLDADIVKVENDNAFSS